MAKPLVVTAQQRQKERKKPQTTNNSPHAPSDADVSKIIRNKHVNKQTRKKKNTTPLTAFPSGACPSTSCTRERSPEEERCLPPANASSRVTGSSDVRAPMHRDRSWHQQCPQTPRSPKSPCTWESYEVVRVNKAQVSDQSQRERCFTLLSQKS
jgi:hypothetical protein